MICFQLLKKYQEWPRKPPSCSTINYISSALCILLVSVRPVITDQNTLIKLSDTSFKRRHHIHGKFCTTYGNDEDQGRTLYLRFMCGYGVSEDSRQKAINLMKATALRKNNVCPYNLLYTTNLGNIYPLMWKEEFNTICYE